MYENIEEEKLRQLMRIQDIVSAVQNGHFE